MAAEEIIKARLEGWAPLTAIVGMAIFAGQAPQNHPAPFVVWQRISGMANHVLDGRTDIRNGRFQVDAWAETYAEAVQIGRAIADAIELANGPNLHAEMQSEMDMYDDEVPAMWRRSMDFLTVERI